MTWFLLAVCSESPSVGDHGGRVLQGRGAHGGRDLHPLPTLHPHPRRQGLAECHQPAAAQGGSAWERERERASGTTLRLRDRAGHALKAPAGCWHLPFSPHARLGLDCSALEASRVLGAVVVLCPVRRVCWQLVPSALVTGSGIAFLRGDHTITNLSWKTPFEMIKSSL